MNVETVSLETLDGLVLEADVTWTDDNARAFVVIAHPHPLHGGDRHNNVVRSLREAALAAGCHSIAPDFRGAGGSPGEHDGGGAERLDLAAACEFAAFVEEDLPVVMAGYSFGAAVSLNVSHPALAGWLAVAAPVGMMSATPVAAHDHRPKHLLLPRHDQFSSVEDTEQLIAEWTNTTLHVLEGVDHFIATGATGAFSAVIDAIVPSG